LLLTALLLAAPRTAHGSCQGGERGLFQAHGGPSVIRSQAFTTYTRSVDRYGLFVDQHMVALFPDRGCVWPHLAHSAIQFSLGAHDEGGAPGGSLVMGGGYGRLLTLAESPVHGPFASLSARQSFNIDRALTHYIVRLPELDLGYGIFTKSSIMRASLFASLEIFASERLKGDLDEDNWTHEHIAAPTLGGKLAVGTAGLRFELDARRVYPRDSELRLDRGRMLACVNFGYAGICGQGAVLRVHDPSLAVEPRGLQVGLTAGVGYGKTGD
jgi:hypothetical protein